MSRQGDGDLPEFNRADVDLAIDADAVRLLWTAVLVPAPVWAASEWQGWAGIEGAAEVGVFACPPGAGGRGIRAQAQAVGPVRRSLM